jgi:hypothetical protein
MIFVHVISGRVRSSMEDQLGHITLLSMQALVFVANAALANLLELCAHLSERIFEQKEKERF